MWRRGSRLTPKGRFPGQAHLYLAPQCLASSHLSSHAAFSLINSFLPPLPSFLPHCRSSRDPCVLTSTPSGKYELVSLSQRL